MSLTLSIITATFNCVSYIKDCLDSIDCQDFPVEHIIVDGCSTDGTLKTLGDYALNRKIISELDQGIYDAMNKGIQLASGDIIGILNADDYYSHSNILQKVVNVFVDTDIDSCYGDLVYVDPEDTSKVVRSWKSGQFDCRNFYWGWMPPHPTFFVRRRVYERYGMFNLKLGSAADYELMLRFLVKHKITTAYIPEILVKMRAGGASNASLKNRLKANRLDRKAWQVNGLKPYPWTTCMKPLRKVGQFLVFG